MAKLGPFCSKDSWSMVRGVLERFMTHLSVWSLLLLELYGLLLVGFAWVDWVVVVLVEGVGAMSVAGTLEVMEGVEGLGELLDGTFGCLLKPLELQSMLSKWW